MILRVGFCGSSGTGKTTLASYVAETFGLPINPIGSRTVSKAMGFDSPYDVDAAGRRSEFQRDLLYEKFKWESLNDSFVTDRTVADVITYTALHCVRSIDETQILDVALGMRRYTHIFYCPESIFCNTDGDPDRVTDLSYQKVYDQCLCGIVRHYVQDSRLLCLIRSELDARKSAVHNFITQSK